jgi:membrane protease YdiL (CAAX protease family)
MFSTGKPLPKILYIIGVLVIFISVYSQYFIRFGPITGYFVVYGIPIMVVSLFFGKELLTRAGKKNKMAFKFGLGLFGSMMVLGIFLSVIALAVVLQFYPNAANLLTKPNPVLNVSPRDALLLIVVSFLVVGPAEEYLFRGFMYGGLLTITKGKYWMPLAVISSLMFSSVHAYYAITYGVASVVVFINLIAFSIAMSVAYYWTGGNILVPAIIHGLYDATGFLGVATTTTVGVIARGILIAVGLVFAVIYLPKKIRLTSVPIQNTPTENTTGEVQIPPVDDN